MTVTAMRAAVVAIRAGAFDDVPGADAVGGGHPDRTRLPWAAGDFSGPVVLVLAGHAGAGASTVALATADGVAAHRRVRLVDYTEPVRSGLAAASAIELGTDGAWRRGRRGRLDILRLARQPADGSTWPPPPPDGLDGLVVVDAGWSLTRAVLEAPGPFGRGATVVVVTRVTVPAVRQTEQLLAAVDGEAVVAAVGAARWPRAVEAGLGPRLGELRSRGRVVAVPVDRRLRTAGLTGDPLPRSVAAAGRSLAALLTPAGPPQPLHRRRAERSRTGPAGQRR